MDQGRSSNLREHCDDVHDVGRVEFVCKVKGHHGSPHKTVGGGHEDMRRDRSVVE